MTAEELLNDLYFSLSFDMRAFIDRNRPLMLRTMEQKIRALETPEEKRAREDEALLAKCRMFTGTVTVKQLFEYTDHVGILFDAHSEQGVHQFYVDSRDHVRVNQNLRYVHAARHDYQGPKPYMEHVFPEVWVGDEWSVTDALIVPTDEDTGIVAAHRNSDRPMLLLGKWTKTHSVTHHLPSLFDIYPKYQVTPRMDLKVIALEKEKVEEGRRHTPFYSMVLENLENGERLYWWVRESNVPTSYHDPIPGTVFSSVNISFTYYRETHPVNGVEYTNCAAIFCVSRNVPWNLDETMYETARFHGWIQALDEYQKAARLAIQGTLPFSTIDPPTSNDNEYFESLRVVERKQEKGKTIILFESPVRPGQLIEYTIPARTWEPYAAQLLQPGTLIYEVFGAFVGMGGTGLNFRPVITIKQFQHDDDRYHAFAGKERAPEAYAVTVATRAAAREHEKIRREQEEERLRLEAEAARRRIQEEEQDALARIARLQNEERASAGVVNNSQAIIQEIQNQIGRQLQPVGRGARPAPAPAQPMTRPGPLLSRIVRPPGEEGERELELEEGEPVAVSTEVEASARGGILEVDSPEVLDAAQVEAAVILQENQGRWNDIQVDWDDAKREAEQAGKDKKEAERIEQDRAAREAFQKERAGIQVREEAFNRRRHEKIQKELRRTEQEAKRKQVGPIARTGTEGVRELETEEGTIERTPEEVEASGRLLEWDDEPIEPGEAPEPTAEEQRDLELDDALDDASERVEAAKKADDPIAVLRAVDTYERTKVELQAPAEAPKTPEGGIDYGELARRHGERRKEAGPKKVWD